jgi:hypothetical protein
MRAIGAIVLGLAAMLAAAGLCGCSSGKPTAEVSGTITLNGMAPDLDGLRICFMAPDGQPVLLDVNKDGTFKGTGVAIGANKLSLNYQAPANPNAAEQRGKARLQDRGAPKDGDPNAGSTPPPKNPIPEQYRDPQNSPKSFMVEADKANVVSWDVTR